MPVQALHHRARFSYPARGISAQTRRFASRWSAAHSPWLIRYIDPLAVEAATWIPEDARLAHLIPEPVKQLAPIARKTAREALGIPTTGRYLSLIGVIDKRKGLNLLLHAFEQADLGPDVRLLLAGKHSDFARRAVRSSSSELVEDDRVIVLDSVPERARLLARVVRERPRMCALPHPYRVVRDRGEGRISRAARVGFRLRVDR